MILKFVVVFGVLLQLKAVSARGVRTDKDQLYLSDGFAEISKTQNGGGSDTNHLLEKLNPKEDPGGHHAVDQENIGSDKRRKFVNGRNAPIGTVNVSMDYTSGKENVTWNVEKKEKTLDMGKEVIKTQQSSCPVTTEELVATAQATVTRALQGLCNSKDMDGKFDELETSITNQLITIKTMILNLEDRLGEHGDAVIYGQKQLSAAISKSFPAAFAGNKGILAVNGDVSNKNQKPSHEYPGPKLKSDEEEEVSGTRDPEILKFNSSIHVETSNNGPARKVFTYYWKIKDMMYKLTGWNPRKSIRSQSFYIFPSGYRMYMRVFPRKDEDHLYVRIGLTKGEFDDTLKWPFPLKHKIHILDQTKEGRLFEDIASRIWDPNLLCSDFNWQKPIKGDNHECIEIGFPHDVLRQREYIQKDALVIKLTVYLES